MRSTRYLAMTLGVVLLSCAGWSQAQAQTPAPKAPATQPTPAATKAPAPAPVRPEDDQAIRASAQAFAKAFQSGDDKAIAGQFTEEAEYVDDANPPVQGRAALAKAYAGLFAQRKELTAEAKTNTVRFLGTDTAIEEGTFTVKSKDAPPNMTRYSALHVRQGGKWLIAMLKEWQDEAPAAPSLQDLEWLIGTWEGAGPEVTARTTYAWNPTKTFIRADFTITPKKEGAKPTTGVQVIGIDPAVGHIRSWLFAADGGIGESTWVHEGNQWVIESVGTLTDGAHTSAINLMTPAGKDAFSWRSVKRVHAGESLPDVAAITVKRVNTQAAVGGR